MNNPTYYYNAITGAYGSLEGGEDLQATAANQEKQIEALAAGLQKLSAQLEVSKRARQTVVNNQ